METPTDLTFHWDLHGHAASWGPQVDIAIPCAYSKAGLSGVPLEALDGRQLLQDYKQLQLLNIPDPDSIRNVICWKRKR